MQQGRVCQPTSTPVLKASKGTHLMGRKILCGAIPGFPIRKQLSWANNFRGNEKGRIPENLSPRIVTDDESSEMIFFKSLVNEDKFSENPIQIVIFWIVEQMQMGQGTTK
jgi:hypothetical protein